MTTEQATEQALAKYPKAKRFAVETFVFSAPDDRMANGINLNADARSYKWNAPTVNAIRMALRSLGKI